MRIYNQLEAYNAANTHAREEWDFSLKKNVGLTCSFGKAARLQRLLDLVT